jgi:hypothetical protein
MTRTHITGTLAAIGGLTATIALLTGLPAAKADELADLRANQELLQRRIDQLAQGELPQTKAFPGVPGAMGTQAVPGAPLAGGSFPRSFLIPGTDTSIRVGGFVDLTGLYFLTGANSGNPGFATTNSGQNGNLNSLPIGQQFVPGLGNVAQSANHSRGNGVFEWSAQQTRINVETRTPTAWGESRTFIEFDFASPGGASNNFAQQTSQQGGSNGLIPRLRFAYGTLGGFLAGQAISNFSDSDADTESMEFGGAMGSTGGNRIAQVRYTIAGPWGSAWSASAETPTVSSITPGGILSSDTNTTALPGGPGTNTIPTICNGVACAGAGGMINDPNRAISPDLTFASYWAQPWGHVDFAGILTPQNVNDGRFISRNYLGFGGHFSGDVKPFSTAPFGLPGAWEKDDFLFSFIAGEGIGNRISGGWSNAVALATNFTVPTSCATPTVGCTGGNAASNVLFNQVFGYSAQGGYQHWWSPQWRSTISAGIAHQDINSQLIGPSAASTATKEQWNAFANIVWSPVSFVTTGFEYMYGKRIVVSNGKGSEQVLAAKFRVAF